LEQVVTYTLSERIGDKAVLEVEFEQLGRDQVVNIPGSSGSIEVESARMTATGRTVLDSKSLVSSGSISGTVADELVLSREEEQENETIFEEFFELEIVT